MESWDRPQKKHVDQKTGREVVTEPPYPSYEWKEGFVLRRLTPEEARNFRADEVRTGATIGDVAYEWVPREQVELND